MSPPVERFLVGTSATLRDVIRCIDLNECGIALVVDAEQRLIGTITDGDVRRAMLANVPLEGAAIELLGEKPNPMYASPITGNLDEDSATHLDTMRRHKIRQLPLVDAAGRVVDVATLDDIVPSTAVRAVVMAGGFGTRLAPLTSTVPKPMLPVGDKPILERIIANLRDAGIKQVSVTTHYKPDAIVRHFGSGERFGVEITYTKEDKPLGTAGALSLLDETEEPLLVVNGDILTDLNYRSLVRFHEDASADMTVCVHQYDVNVPFGVVEVEGIAITQLSEKPTFHFFVNAGVYLLSPAAARLIPKGERYDMPQLIHALLAAGKKVVSFPIRESWLDIGRPADYEKAQSVAAQRDDR